MIRIKARDFKYHDDTLHISPLSSHTKEDGYKLFPYSTELWWDDLMREAIQDEPEDAAESIMRIDPTLALKIVASLARLLTKVDSPPRCVIPIDQQLALRSLGHRLKGYERVDLS